MELERFSYLVRFLDDENVEHFGDAEQPFDDQPTRARVIEGDIFGDYQVTNTLKTIRKLLSPLTLHTTHTIRGLGINYKGVPEKMHMTVPEYPLLFYKPITSLANPFDDIQIAPSAQDDGLDCEVELAVVIGKAAHEVSAKEAMDYILGYAVGNDFTHYGWMKKGNRSGALGKHQDNWTPIGPGIVSAHMIEDAQDLRLWAKINGEIVQDGSTKDMIFCLPELISFLSQGTTLLPGDVILTGSPLGVRATWDPPVWLKDGDVMELGVEKIGSIRNKVLFRRPCG